MSPKDLSNSTNEDSAQPIELGWSSQRLSLRDSKEDWTGKTDPSARRKLQNRLNQRARRERARAKVSPENTAVAHGSISRNALPSNGAVVSGSPAGSSSSGERSSPTTLVPKQPQLQGCMASIPEVQHLMNRFADHAYASYMQGAPALAHLPLLVRYNVSTALATNAALLGVTEEFFKWEGISPMNKQGPLLGLTWHDQFTDWPASLQPTQFQLSMEHHPWVDCFPWPRLRDNLLRAFEHPDLCDEDELCHDISGYHDTEKGPMLIIWGSPWDPRSWEVSDEFLRKWAWLINGCGDVITGTNYWRSKRGEALITPQAFAAWVRLSLPDRLRPSGV